MKVEFSIIVATKNAASTLPNLLRSLELQEYSNWELLIADCRSDDRTMEIIEANKSIITYFRSVYDYGIYDAWNSLLTHAKGTHFIFMGADDIFSSNDSLKNLQKFISSNPNFDAYYNDVLFVDDGRTWDKKLTGSSWDIESNYFPSEMRFGHTGLVHSRRMFEIVGQFNQTYKISGDYDLLLRFFYHNKNSFVYTHLSPVKMGRGGVSTSPKGKYKAYIEAFRTVLTNSKLISYPLLLRVVKSYVHFVLWKLRILPAQLKK